MILLSHLQSFISISKSSVLDSYPDPTNSVYVKEHAMKKPIQEELLYQACTANSDYAQKTKLGNNKLATKYRTWKYEMTDNMGLC